MAIAQTATNAFKTGLMNGTFNFSTDTFNIALYTASASLDATTAAYTAANEVVASGYTAGGQALTVTVAPTTGDTGTTAYISFANTSWTTAVTARAALIYKAGSGNPTVCVLDFGSDKTSATTFTVQFPAATNTSAIIRLA
jgi:hypothetical protein